MREKEAWGCWLLRFALALLIGACISRPAAPQERPPEYPPIPFEQWVAEGPRQQIPWRVKIFPTVLLFHQRLSVLVEVEVSSNALAARGPQHELYLVARLKDSNGQWIEQGGILGTRIEKLPPRHAHIQFRMNLLVLPGEYTLCLVLYDRETGEHNVDTRPLRVHPLAQDWLPAASRNLPRVEFLRDTGALDRYFRPELRGKLWLPLATRQPVRVEVLVNFTVAEELTRRPRTQWVNPAFLLMALRVFTQMDIPNGSLGVAGLDLVRRKVIFEQRDARTLDWPRLREALEGIEQATIDAQALARRKENPAFFNEVLASRLAEPEAQTAAGNSSAGERPLRVIIVLSNAFLFPPGAKLDPISSAGDCHCRVYYFQRGELWDQLERLMKPLHPRKFTIRTPLDFRRALAEMLEDLGHF